MQLKRILRFIKWRKKSFGYCLLALGIILGINQFVARYQGETEAFLVIREIAAGQIIQEQDLRKEIIPQRLLPKAAVYKLESVLGKTAAIDLLPNQVLTESMVVFGKDLDLGAAIVPVPVSQELRSLLYVGARLDLSTTVADSSEVLVKNALVVGLPKMENKGFSANSQQIVLIQVSRDLAAKVGQYANQKQLNIALRG